MKYAGVFFTLLFGISLWGSVALVQHLKEHSNATAGGYVCPPCACPRHEEILPQPGICASCGMPLISVERPHSNLWESLFRSHRTNFYHHKLFYPINFLALFIGVFALFRFRRELPMVLFFVYFFSLVLYSFKNQLYGTEYSMHASREWAFCPISLLLAAGPALYLYLHKRRTGDTSFLLADWLHFLPVVPVLGLNAALFWGPESWRDLAFYNNYDHFPGLAEQLTFVASAGFYGVLILKERARSPRQAPPFERWQTVLQVILWGLLLCLIVLIAGNWWFFDLMSTWLDYHPVWLLIALFTLWSIWHLVFRKEVIFEKSTPRERENRLPEARLAALKTELEQLMHTRRPYLDPDLSLPQLAALLGLKDKDLSEVLNSGLGKTFNDYVNTYRIEAVKQLLLDPDKQHLTNEAIAEEAGFSSKSAFFGLFKRHVGMTPGEFKKTVRSSPGVG